jgi:hypothetical protein
MSIGISHFTTYLKKKDVGYIKNESIPCIDDILKRNKHRIKSLIEDYIDSLFPLCYHGKFDYVEKIDFLNGKSIRKEGKTYEPYNIVIDLALYIILIDEYTNKM